MRPKPKRRAHQEKRQNASDHHQLETEARRDIAKGQRPVAIAVHRADGRLIFVIGVGEEFDRLDIGDRIDNLPRHPRPRRRTAFRLGANARQIVADEQKIADQPNAEHGTDPPVDRQDQQARRNDRRQRENHGVDRFDRRLGQRPRRLHLLLRDAAREIVVEKGYVLPQRPAMQAREDQDVEVWVENDRLKRRRHPEEKWPNQDHEAGDCGKEPTVGLE